MTEVSPRLLSQRYIVTEPLGEGGMAEVWRAWDRRQNLWCAVKILRDRYVQQPRSLQRFLDEGNTMIALGHRNVIDAWDLVQGARPFLVMEIAEGGSLKDWVDRNGSMPPRMAVDVAIQISKGIGAAHKIGVVHRDIKPHNILLNRRGQCKVTDFGIARLMRPDGSTDVPDAATGTQHAMGTLGYMAPEQRTDPRSADVRTDVYGIGATLYTLLTGRVVTNLFIAEREPELLEGIPDELVPVLMQATAYKPEQRYDTVQDLAKALFDVRSELPEDPQNTSPLAPDLPPEAAAPPTPAPAEPRSLGPGVPALPAGLRNRTLSPPSAIPRVAMPNTPTPAEFRTVSPAEVDDDDSIDEPPPRSRAWIAVPAVALALLVLLLVLDALWVGTAASTARRASRDLIQVVEAQASVVDKLAKMGADRETLQGRLQSLVRAQGASDAERAGGDFVRALDEAAETLAAARTDQDFYDAMNSIHQIEEAQRGLESAIGAWRQRADGVGRPAVTFGLAPAPD